MSKNVEEALALLRNAAADRPEDFSIRQRLVEACLRAGQSDEAVREFRALVTSTPEYSQVHFETLGRASRGGYEDALCTAFERATKSDPEDPLTWYGLGLSRQLRNDQDGATDAFKAGIQKGPYRFWALLEYNLGVAVMDYPMQAEMWLVDAAQHSPNMAEPHYALGTLYMTREPMKAAYHFREFIRLAPPHLQSVADNARFSLKLLGEVD
jgi:tetratricopeptide (TPR) repeat protein